VRNDPVNLRDPSGLFFEDDDDWDLGLELTIIGRGDDRDDDEPDYWDDDWDDDWDNNDYYDDDDGLDDWEFNNSFDDSAASATSQSVDVHLRTFAPFESFGGGFEGDDRSFSTDLNATSRIAGKVTIAPATGQVLGATARSSPSSCAGAPCSLVLGDSSRTGTPTISTRNVNGAIVVNMAGANPLVRGAPNIHLSLTLRVGPNGGFSGSLAGDAFPNAEVFVVGPGGATMLHKFSTSGGPLTGPFLYLPGANTRPMGDF